MNEILERLRAELKEIDGDLAYISSLPLITNAEEFARLRAEVERHIESIDTVNTRLANDTRELDRIVEEVHELEVEIERVTSRLEGM